jgi:hypothetical protein
MELHEKKIRLAGAPETEFSFEFVQMMANRMVVSYHKYGPVAKGYPHPVDALESLRQRLKKYLDTGNTEFLIDAANFAMIEFMCPSLQDAEFVATDSDGSPGRTFNDGSVSSDHNEGKSE